MKAIVYVLGLAVVFLVVWRWWPDRSTTAHISQSANRSASEPATHSHLEQPVSPGTDSRVAAQEPDPTSTSEPATDPCAELRAEFAATEAELRHRLEVLRQNEGRTPVEHLTTLPDAQMLDDRGRKFLEALLARDMPFYLRPGEALWIAEYEATQPWSTADVIRFLGPQRLLAEAPPSWIELRKGFYDEAEWLAIFGTPRPPD